MKIATFVVGMLGVNSYIVHEEGGQAALVIDPGDDAGRLAAYLAENNLTDITIVLTHGHSDHIGALDELRRLTGAKAYIHEADAPFLADDGLNLSAYMGISFTTAPADDFLIDGEEINIGGLSFTVLHTPGHSPGGICLYGEGKLFSGDTVFAGSVGRTDFPCSSVVDLGKSIREKILPLPDETEIYPGHGPASNVGWEKRHNPFFR